MKKKIALEDLAAMVQRGFDGTASKDDLRSMATKDDLRELETRVMQAIEELTTKLSAYMTTVREDYVRLQGRVVALEEQVAELQGRRHRRAT